MNRSIAIDAYRGLTIAFMIIVNTPGTWENGKIFSPLLHADWHGCTPTDLVFPSFLFIVGASMWFAYAKYGRKLSPEVTSKILKRTGIIFLIGLLLNWFPFVGTSLGELRIMGVLQRIALAFGLGAFLCLGLDRKWLIRTSVLLLVGYYALLLLFHAAGGDPFGLEYNAVRRFDLWLFGAGHLWDGKGIPFDPEGLLSSIPSAVTVVLGYLSGMMLDHYRDRSGQVVVQLLIFGVVCIALGLVWSVVFPINKALWTSSYVLYAGGISMLLLAGMYWFYEARQYGIGSYFLDVFGKNPLFAYVLSGILAKTLYSIQWAKTPIKTEGEPAMTNAYQALYESVFVDLGGPKLGSFLFALAFMMVCWLACWLLYRKKVFIKI